MKKQHIGESKFAAGNTSGDEKVRFWREAGQWRCALPRDDFATQHGFSWKHFGLIGRGSTQAKALEDWRAWQRASDFVASIY